MPPDLSPYRLPAETSLQIFNSEIVPAEFDNLPEQTPTPDATPLAVLVVGQTGAGKTRLSPAILSALRLVRGAAAVAHLIADTYKAYHPAYRQLMASTPQLASPATGPDARTWLAMAAGEATRRGIDVLVESACRQPGDFEDLVRLFGGAGYRVEVVVLAVPMALSRLGVLVRYYEGLPEGRSGRLAGRLTPEGVHDDSYRGLLGAARFLDESGLAHLVVVVRRGGLVAHGVGEGVQGRLGDGSVARALERERERVLSGEEARTALDDIRRLDACCGASERVGVVRDMLGSLIAEGENRGGRNGEWPELKPLAFGKLGVEAGGTYNVLRLGQI